jgi:uncharacterized protein (TIGR00299 family) protein
MAHHVLYLDPWSGLSGDMLLGALLDAGRAGPVDGERLEDMLREVVDSLQLAGVVIHVERGSEWGVRCTRVTVQSEESPPVRRLADMLERIDLAAVSDRVRARAAAAVRHLAEVEAGIHGCAVDEIHFHELGGADTLVDIVGTFALVETLGIEKVFVGTIPVGGGTVEIAHGRMGVPAPATAALLAGYAAVGGPEMRELTTPTGALLVTQLHAVQGPLPSMTVEAVGYGAGMMKLEKGPNLLRVVLGEEAESADRPGDGPHAAGGETVGTVVTADGGAQPLPIDSSPVIELQTNIDHLSPEVIGYALRRLREAGVLDAWAAPVFMKKDRPGTVLHVLVRAEGELEAVEILFAETGTLGVRRFAVERYVAERGTVCVKAGNQEVSVKWGRWNDRLVSVAPEYEDAAAAAAAAARPLADVMQEAAEAARRLLEQGGHA